MKYKIFKDNNPIMRQKSQEVTLPLSNEDKETLDFMLDYLKKSQDDNYAKKHHVKAGIGLAAIQIGILKRMFVFYIENQDGTIFQGQFVNPKIIETSMKKCALESGEGCLSVDKEHPGLVHRYHKITIKAFDALSNKEVTLTTSGLGAICLQHEHDHLDGIFYYDRIDKFSPDKPLPGEIIL